MSKLDYLKKYTGGTEKSGHGKKKRKISSTSGNGVRVIDEDQPWTRKDDHKENTDDRWEALDKDDGPVVVDESELIGAKSRADGLVRGTWEEITPADRDEGVKRSRTYSDDSDAEVRRPPENKERAKTASGHYAGLQTGDAFGKTERQLHEANKRALAAADKTLSGANSETVYRDKSGKKVDMIEEYLKKEAIKQSKKTKILAAQQDYNLGTAQKKLVEEKMKELEEIAQEPFARTIDDPKLESWKKESLREGDPMAEYFQKKKDQEERERRKNQSNDPDKSVKVHDKPIYRGPNAPVNRFGIRPGYRWDGIDRGNQFERKVLLKTSEKISFKEDQYKWSVADM